MALVKTEHSLKHIVGPPLRNRCSRVQSRPHNSSYVGTQSTSTFSKVFRCSFVGLRRRCDLTHRRNLWSRKIRHLKIAANAGLSFTVRSCQPISSDSSGYGLGALLRTSFLLFALFVSLLRHFQEDVTLSRSSSIEITVLSRLSSFTCDCVR